MTKLLHVSASPRGPKSESLPIAEALLHALAQSDPAVEIEHWDLWDGTLPAFGPEAVAAKMAVFGGADPEGDAASAWRSVKQAFQRFADADQYLFSVPMWNHQVPYILKQLIDVISQPGMAFGFNAEQGYTPLLTGRTAAVIYTGAVWGPERDGRFGRDFLSPYFEDWLRWAGISHVGTVRFQPNIVATDVDEARQRALVDAAALGRRLATDRAA